MLSLSFALLSCFWQFSLSDILWTFTRSVSVCSWPTVTWARWVGSPRGTYKLQHVSMYCFSKLSVAYHFPLITRSQKKVTICFKKEVRIIKIEARVVGNSGTRSESIIISLAVRRNSSHEIFLWSKLPALSGCSLSCSLYLSICFEKSQQMLRKRGQDHRIWSGRCGQ